MKSEKSISETGSNIRPIKKTRESRGELSVLTEFDLNRLKKAGVVVKAVKAETIKRASPVKSINEIYVNCLKSSENSENLNIQENLSEKYGHFSFERMPINSFSDKSTKNLTQSNDGVSCDETRNVTSLHKVQRRVNEIPEELVSKDSNEMAKKLKRINSRERGIHAPRKSSSFSITSNAMEIKKKTTNMTPLFKIRSKEDKIIGKSAHDDLKYLESSKQESKRRKSRKSERCASTSNRMEMRSLSNTDFGLTESDLNYLKKAHVVMKRLTAEEIKQACSTKNLTDINVLSPRKCRRLSENLNFQENMSNNSLVEKSPECNKTTDLSSRFGVKYRVNKMSNKRDLNDSKKKLERNNNKGHVVDIQKTVKKLEGCAVTLTTMEIRNKTLNATLLSKVKCIGNETIGESVHKNSNQKLKRNNSVDDASNAKKKFKKSECYASTSNVTKIRNSQNNNFRLDKSTFNSFKNAHMSAKLLTVSDINQLSPVKNLNEISVSRPRKKSRNSENRDVPEKLSEKCAQSSVKKMHKNTFSENQTQNLFESVVDSICDKTENLNLVSDVKYRDNDLTGESARENQRFSKKTLERNSNGKNLKNTPKKLKKSEACAITSNALEIRNKHSLFKVDKMVDKSVHRDSDNMKQSLENDANTQKKFRKSEDCASTSNATEVKICQNNKFRSRAFSLATEKLSNDVKYLEKKFNVKVNFDHSWHNEVFQKSKKDQLKKVCSKVIRILPSTSAQLQSKPKGVGNKMDSEPLQIPEASSPMPSKTKIKTNSYKSLPDLNKIANALNVHFHKGSTLPLKNLNKKSPCETKESDVTKSRNLKNGKVNNNNEFGHLNSGILNQNEKMSSIGGAIFQDSLQSIKKTSSFVKLLSPSHDMPTTCDINPDTDSLLYLTPSTEMHQDASAESLENSDDDSPLSLNTPPSYSIRKSQEHIIYRIHQNENHEPIDFSPGYIFALVNQQKPRWVSRRKTKDLLNTLKKRICQVRLSMALLNKNV